MQPMIRFLKDVYLAGFAIVFRLSRAKDIAYKAGSATGALTVIDWFIMIGIFGYIEMSLDKQFMFSKPLVIIAFFALFFLNGYVLFVRGHGVKFAREFDHMEKSRRIVLVVSCTVIAVAAVVFFICSGIAYRRFTGVH